MVEVEWHKAMVEFGKRDSLAKERLLKMGQRLKEMQRTYWQIQVTTHGEKLMPREMEQGLIQLPGPH